MDYSERANIYHEAINKWGDFAQKLMAIEEMAELIQALCKDFRGKLDLLNVIEETADVKIMMEQLEILFGTSEAVEAAMDTKIDRLRGRLHGKE